MMNVKFILVLFLLILSACSPVEMEPPAAIDVEQKIENPAYLEGEWIYARVDRVVDGDTIVINDLDIEQVRNNEVIEGLSKVNSGVRVRFLAVDTPEDTKVKQVYGKESTALVKQLLEGNDVIIEIDPNATFDKYDRLLGHAFTVNGVNIQHVLLRNGLARVAYLFDDYKYVDDYFAAEQAARSEQLHIHAIEGYVTDYGFDMNVVGR